MMYCYLLAIVCVYRERLYILGLENYLAIRAKLDLVIFSPFGSKRPVDQKAINVISSKILQRIIQAPLDIFGFQ